MADDYVEFSIDSNRRYTRDHLWLQILDKEEGTWKVGVSDCIVKEIGEILHVIPAEVDEEFSDGDVIFSLRAEKDSERFDAPFSGQVVEVNNELEATPELVYDDTYNDGWILIIKPHELDEDQFLTAEEYIESLSDY